MISFEAELVAKGLRHFGLFKDRSQSPDGKGFKLKLHETNPDAPLSPYYVDLRGLRSMPRLMCDVVRVFIQLTEGLVFDLYADVPTAATPLVAVLSYLTDRPMISPRQPKAHGTGASIDGLYRVGETALVVDDLITGAHSKIEAIRALEGHGLIVRDVVVLLDRQQGGREELEKAGYTLHAAFTTRELLAFYRREGLIEAALCDEITAYMDANA